MFSEEALLRDASARTGLADFGPDVDDWRTNLAALVEAALGEAKLRDPSAFRALLVHHLANRVRIQACFALCPAISDVQIPRPLFISGLPRAGTTTFSRLIGEDPGARTLRLWELISPAPTDLAQPAALTEDRITAAENIVLDRARRGTLDIRPMSIFMADECFYLMRNSFDSDHLHRAVARMPSYFAAMASRDRRGVYAFYRRQLQLLLWQRPCAPNGRLVLKNPFVHLENMRTIFDLFPGATIVNLTRDVGHVMRSLCFKNRADRRAHSDHVSSEDVGRDMVDNLVAYYDRRARSLATLSRSERARVITITYRAWADDPLAIMRELYAKIGEPFTPQLEARMASGLDKHQRYGEQAKYDLRELGLDEDALRERFEPEEAAFAKQVTVIEGKP
jgi:hypothetical protein